MHSFKKLIQKFFLDTVYNMNFNFEILIEKESLHRILNFLIQY